MKLLVVCSSLDLRAPLSCTPYWWQLLKALAETGVELVVMTYHGPSVESPWWRVYPNPCKREGDLFEAARRWARQLRAARTPGPANRRSSRDTAHSTRHSALPLGESLRLRLAHAWVAPRWRAHLERIVERERDVDALLMLTVPLNQLVGVARAMREKHGIPAVFYDGDVPASLPSFRGFATGFRIYQGADLSEYDLFVSNSKGGLEELKRLGARNVEVIYFGADPELYRPVDVEQDIDVFFYGHTSEYREAWMEAMLAEPSREMPDARFAVRGVGFGTDLGRVEKLPYLSFSRLKEYCCRSKINLSIVRDAHASVYGSSNARIFELAAMACCTVSNPHLGIEEWFEPGREVLVVHDREEAVDAYRELLANPMARREMGERARERLLREHTVAARAKQLAAALEKLESRRSG